MNALIPLAGALATWVAAFVIWAWWPAGRYAGYLRLPLMIIFFAVGNGLLFLAARLLLR